MPHVTATNPARIPRPARLATPFCFLFATTALFAQPTSRPADTDPALWQKLLEIDHRASTISDLTADFRQEKFTPLLRKPLISTGTIRVKGDAMLWDTRSPEPTQMRVDPQEIRLYYPRQRVLEIFPVDRRLGSLAASPLPRLDVLRRYFSFQRTDPASLGDDVKGDHLLALKLTPVDPALAEHLQHVLVLLDAPRGLILRAEMADADGERTRLLFSNVQSNRGLKDGDVRLDVPDDTKVTRPLEGFGGAAAGSSLPDRHRQDTDRQP